MLTGSESYKHSRKPDIMADAAYAILTKDSKTTTGNFFIDDEVLKAEGVSDMKQYACDPNNADNLMTDFFLDNVNPSEVVKEFGSGGSLKDVGKKSMSTAAGK